MISNIFDHQYDLGVKGQGEIYIKAGCLGNNTNFSNTLDGGYSYLTQCVSKVLLLLMTRKLLDSSQGL